MKSEEKATVKFVVLQIKKPVTVWPEASAVCFYSRSPNDQVIAEFCENLFFFCYFKCFAINSRFLWLEQCRKYAEKC